MKLPTLLTLLASLSVGLVLAKLPPLDDEAKTKAMFATAKTAYGDKVGLYKLCLAMDRTAEGYRASAKATGKEAPAVDPMPTCADPGPFVAPIDAAASKPLEAAGAHSPAGMAVSPPSNKATSAEMTGKSK